MLLASGMGLVLALSLMQVPAALLLGPVIAATVIGLRGTALYVPRGAHEFAQGVAGCMIAGYLTPDIFQRILVLWPYVLIFATMTLVLASFVGLMLGLFSRVDPEVAIWGFLPGMAGAVIAMSHERGLDSRLVAFIQILRLMAVIVVMSVISRLVMHGQAVPSHPDAELIYSPRVIITLLVALSGPLAGRFLPLPAAATLVPLILAAALQASGWSSLALPNWLLILAYFLLGTQVGLRFTPQIMAHALSVLGLVLGASLGLMVLCAISGLVLSQLIGVDMLTGMLATVPGSIETIAIIAVNTHANLSFIMTMQVIRLFAVVLAGPYLARALSHWARRFAAPRAAPGE